ncbi:hypothetical protein CENDO_06385 [Corynebacterium endometrii]|uniref:DUF3817 domain-containing protein n=2 Tax=Corynebacterium endometrii TaxID=2488819 RepID=A0A4P7QHP0_9CORY|nr:hypothetical protein CENDO_06385 [Corynebacterium endometrii]
MLIGNDANGARVNQCISIMSKMLPMSPHKLHRTAACIEMVTWSLIIIGMILKYSNTTEALMPIFGGIHGFGFLCFVAMTILVWANDRWPAWLGIAGLAVSAIPFAALPFAMWVGKKGFLGRRWRFGNGDDAQPETFTDRALATVVRKPARSAAVCLAIIIVVFAVLLYLGPPVDVESVIRS